MIRTHDEGFNTAITPLCLRLRDAAAKIRFVAIGRKSWGPKEEVCQFLPRQISVCVLAFVPKKQIHGIVSA